MAAGTIIFFVLMICVGGILTIGFSVPVNEILSFMNEEIAGGTVSATFVGYFSFVVGILAASPILIIISSSIWAIVRAIERRNEGV